jgi:pimeloyl-ACP methyl ester carboxylesterase
MLSHADLADLCALAYRGPQSVTVSVDARCCLLPRGGELVVVCPGTHLDDLVDWLRDLDWVPAPFDKIGWCHRGFGAGARDLWAAIRRELPSDKRIVFTGHSLGGALALGLAGLHIAEGRSPPRLVTFGAPRVAFALNFALRQLVRRGTLECVEYRRRGDPVPTVPPRPIFKHVTRGVAIGAPLPAPPGVIDEFVAKVGDHDVQRYRADLQALNC